MECGEHRGLQSWQLTIIHLSESERKLCFTSQSFTRGMILYCQAFYAETANFLGDEPDFECIHLRARLPIGSVSYECGLRLMFQKVTLSLRYTLFL